jgi:hypothetical protein
MNKTMEFASKELDILMKSAPDPENRPIIEPFIPEILSLVNKFGNSGQSGGSAPYTASALASAIRSLCLQEPLSPVTGEDHEWVDVGHLGDGSEIHYQNRRCGALFKNNDGKCWYLDAIVWVTQTGAGWIGSAFLDGEKITSRQCIKEFPFFPKTFKIDVIEKEVAPDDWEFYIKDPNQLKEVFNYYNKF